MRLNNNALDVGLLQTENPLCAHPGRPTEFYHGTSLEAILGIQANGFRVDLSGSNAGQALGEGVYMTTTLEKALNYAKGKLSAQVGRARKLGALERQP